MAFTKAGLETAVVFPMAYGFSMIALFAILYKLMGLEKNFVITDEIKDNPWFGSFYISAMAQTNAMGDATPKTIPGRIVFCLQTILGWLWVVTFAVLVAAYFSS